MDTADSSIQKEIVKAQQLTVAATLGLIVLSGCMLWFGMRGSLPGLAEGPLNYEQWDLLVDMHRLVVREMIPLMAIAVAFCALMVVHGLCYRNILEKQMKAAMEGVAPSPSLNTAAKLIKGSVYGVLLIALTAGVYLDSKMRPAPRPDDATLRTKLVGSWMKEGVGMSKFTSDGKFSSGWTNIHTRPAKAWIYGGTWELTNGACVITTTTTNALNTTNLQALGTIEHWKIVQLDDTKLIWELNGQRVSLTRRN